MIVVGRMVTEVSHHIVHLVLEDHKVGHNLGRPLVCDQNFVLFVGVSFDLDEALARRLSNCSSYLHVLMIGNACTIFTPT